jgi:hypothetical protein
MRVERRGRAARAAPGPDAAQADLRRAPRLALERVEERQWFNTEKKEGRGILPQPSAFFLVEQPEP